MLTFEEKLALVKIASSMEDEGGTGLGTVAGAIGGGYGASVLGRSGMRNAKIQEAAARLAEQLGVPVESVLVGLEGSGEMAKPSMRAILGEDLAALRSVPGAIAGKARAAGESIADAARYAYNAPRASASAVGSSLIDAAEAGAGKVKGGYAAIKAMLANAARFAAKYSPRL